MNDATPPRFGRGYSSGRMPASELPPPPGTNAVMEAYGWQTGRILDPVRAAALHEAVRTVAWGMDDEERLPKILAAAKMFEAWLEGPERFEAYLVEEDEAGL